MNTMGFYVWLLPVLFMIHEFEEIFMIETWFDGHKEKINRLWPTKKPFGLDNTVKYLTPTIAIGIFGEFVITILICLFCLIFDNYYVWYAFTVGFILMSVLLHGRLTIQFKGYTPGIVTIAILLIPCIWLLYQSNTILHYGAVDIIVSTLVVNGLFGLASFRLLHNAMIPTSKWLSKIAETETREILTGEAAVEN
jgi:hypothetical protein